MADIATLGLAVDSSQVKNATSALSGLSAAAKPATAATNDHAKAHAGLSTQAMAAQHSMRSMIEAMASGQPVSQAFAQQLNHLSYAATGPGGLVGAFKQAGGAILGLLSPATLIAGGLIGIGAAGVLAVSSVAKTEKQFDDVSRAVGTTLTQLHALESAAAFKGIDTAEFLKAMDRFGASVYDAQHNMGGLAETFRANGVQAKSFDDYLAKAADLIKNASTEQQRLQLLQSMGLPATADWVRLLQGGSEGLKAATAEATKFGDAADEQLIAKARAFDEAWNKATKNAGTYFKNLVVEGSNLFAALNGKINEGLMKAGVNVGKNLLTDAFNGGSTQGTRLTANSNVDDFYKGTGAGLGAAANAPKPTVDPAVLQRQIAAEQPLLGPIGQTPVVAQAKPALPPVKEKPDDRDHRRLAA